MTRGEKATDESAFRLTVRRMLATPPQPHATGKKKKGGKSRPKVKVVRNKA